MFKRTIILAFLPFALPLSVSAATIDVKTMVQGFTGLQTIGIIDVTTGNPTTDAIKGLFNFSDPFKGSILDGWYDFQWVNVVTSKIGADSPLFDKYPNIDPQAPPKNPREDDQPYYWNQSTEWLPQGKTITPSCGKNNQPDGTDVSNIIHKEGESSVFFDCPQRGINNGFNFNTFFVAQDLTAGDFTGKKFDVLAGFSWTYTGGTSGNAGEDVSTFGSFLPIDATALTLINTSMGNEANNKFAGWTSLKDQTLKPCIPEPSSILSLLALGTLGAASTLKRKLKPSKSKEKELTKVG